MSDEDTTTKELDHKCLLCGENGSSGLHPEIDRISESLVVRHIETRDREVIFFSSKQIDEMVKLYGV